MSATNNEPVHQTNQIIGPNSNVLLKIRSKNKTSSSEIFETNMQAREEDEEEDKSNSKKKLSKDEIREKIRKISQEEYTAQINLLVFFEFLFYHLLYLLILGPLTPLVMIFFKGGYKLAINFGFTFHKPVLFIVQTLTWIVNVAPIYMYVYATVNNMKTSISDTEFEIILFGVFFRSVTIAAKYGSFSIDHIKLLRSERVPDNFFTSKLMVRSWFRLNEECLQQEYKYAVRRNNLELSSFKLHFMGKLPESRLKILKELHILNGYPENEFDDRIINGELIAKDLIKWASNKRLTKKTIIISIIFTILRTQSLNGIRQGNGIFWFGDSWFDAIITTFVFASGILSYTPSLIFFITASQDLKMKYLLLSQLSHLIAPFHCAELPSTKLYPTQQLACTESFRSWMNLRIIFSDFGQSFFNRGVVIVTAIASVSILKTILVSLMIFNLVVVNDRDRQVLYVTYVIDLYPIMLTIITGMMLGAKINSLFKLQHKLINVIKIVFVNLKDRAAYFFEEIHDGSFSDLDNKFITKNSLDAIVNKEMSTCCVGKKKKDSQIKVLNPKIFKIKNKTDELKSIQTLTQKEDDKSTKEISIEHYNSGLSGFSRLKIKNLSTNPLYKKTQKVCIKVFYSMAEVKSHCKDLISTADLIKEELLIAEEMDPQKFLGISLTYGLIRTIGAAVLSVCAAAAQYYFSKSSKN